MPKITDLTELTTAALDDVVAIVDDVAGTPTTKKITLANFLATGLLKKSYTHNSRSGSTGINYHAGFYFAPSADANLTQASLTQTLGSANAASAAHAFVVAAAAGTTDGSDLVLTVTGTSITDAGVRTGADSEVVVADATAVVTDQYLETSKKWIGQVTYTLSSTGGTTYSFDFNYGFAKYEDFGNRDFTVTDFEAVGDAAASDSNPDIRLLLHDGTGWTYSAAAFTPGGTAIVGMNADYSTESEFAAGEPFAYKRTGLSQDVDGSSSEGVVIEITTTANNAIADMDAHIGITLR